MVSATEQWPRDPVSHLGHDGEKALEDAFRRLEHALREGLPTMEIHAQIESVWEQATREREAGGTAAGCSSREDE